MKVRTQATAPFAPQGQPGVTPTPVPPPELMLSTESVYQGGTILLSLVGQVKEGSVTFLNRTRRLSKGKQSIYTFIGIDTEDRFGTQTLRVDFSLVSGSKGSLTAQVRVLENRWTVDAIVLPPSLSILLDPKVNADEQTILNQVYGGASAEKLWDGPWLVPSGGPVTTRFGEERSYNGGPVSGHHLGTDIGAADGAPVGATNAGRVVMARQVQLRGNMVIVDHGGGLFSGYAHLKSFAVAEGQDVQPGDAVGFVGSSGLSTGAHLHWEMVAGGVFVDALRFTDGSNGF